MFFVPHFTLIKPHHKLDHIALNLFIPITNFHISPTMAKIRAFFFLTLLLLSSSFFIQVARSQSDSVDSDADAELVAETVKEGEYVGDDTHDFSVGNYNPAPGVETVSVFPKNPVKLVVAGQETELLVGLKNEGEQSVNVVAVHATVHLPFDHRMLVQNLSVMSFNNASVPASVQATFPYIFAVSKFLQPGTFDLVGTIVYEIDQQPYQNTFYNRTIEVTEAGGLVSVETVFLVSLGLALLVLLGLWVRTQLQSLSKKTKKITKVEVGTRTVDASMDEWLQGTAYTQSQSNKLKKKK
ncbi:putative translocon-associated protein (TRAP), alpha subunit [Helianthus annuus]|uniref:Translocon-associated protein subunit alpha n=2 Tax=Helianthus annuus TaxID=4232 RepID=A0A251S883_HELAN|nr:putative translocon-associated protein (TRAP), alpha subunit [Helianthus annuus]KAJ0455508.1 putative translocon-associated protein (TRAP), alpha subunit [Helianthus annuus]KAJ0472968.1 putative translocon-associated protein (TRAP), alpha subunit [Helianthus annuus]KAJ0648572.1 putative translocon-associated protein (TRAP), alpha subunit [Helianthus annuus]KAJ0652395.1 putative translocon-associated protein (TRAP), alpha subunit [Helianthus annuus]